MQNDDMSLQDVKPCRGRGKPPASEVKEWVQDLLQAIGPLLAEGQATYVSFSEVQKLLGISNKSLRSKVISNGSMDSHSKCNSFEF